MGYYLSVPILLMAVILQMTILPGLRWYDGQPDLVLLIVLAWSVHAEWEEATWWAVFGSIAQDIVSIVPTGTSLGGLLVTVFAVRYLAEQMMVFRLVFLFIMVVVGTALQHVVLYFVLSFTVGAPNLTNMIQRFSVTTLLLNLALILPIYFVLRRIQKRLPEPQSAW